MAKDRSTPIDTESTGRYHDGYGYLVFTKDGQKISFADADALSNVQARWLEARKDPTNGLVTFTGARRAISFEEDGRVITEVGKYEGAGAVLAASVVAIRYVSPADDHAEEALNAVRALHDIQSAAMEAAADEAAGKGQVEATVEDEELEGGFKS